MEDLTIVTYERCDVKCECCGATGSMLVHSDEESPVWCPNCCTPSLRILQRIETDAIVSLADAFRDEVRAALADAMNE